MASISAPKGLRKAGTQAASRLSQSKKGFSFSAFLRPQQSAGGEFKGREQHEGEKNGRRGLRNSQALPTLCSLCGDGVPHYRPFSFSHPPALRNRYLGLDLQIVRRLCKKNQRSEIKSWGVEQNRDLGAHRRCYRLSFCFLFCIQHI